jgi:hypothetical protein
LFLGIPRERGPQAALGAPPRRPQPHNPFGLGNDEHEMNFVYYSWHVTEMETEIISERFSELEKNEEMVS